LPYNGVVAVASQPPVMATLPHVWQFSNWRGQSGILMGQTLLWRKLAIDASVQIDVSRVYNCKEVDSAEAYII